MKNLFTWLKPNVTRTDRVVASIALFLLLSVGLVACPKIDWEALKTDDTLDLLITESVDAFGYTLGCLASKDPILEAKIKYYHDRVVKEGLTVAIVNEALRYLFDSDELIYRNLARKLTRLTSYFGAKFDVDGNLTEFGAISEKYLTVGKDAYLTAIAESKKVVSK